MCTRHVHASTKRHDKNVREYYSLYLPNEGRVRNACGTCLKFMQDVSGLHANVTSELSCIVVMTLLRQNSGRYQNEGMLKWFEWLEFRFGAELYAPFLSCIICKMLDYNDGENIYTTKQLIKTSGVTLVSCKGTLKAQEVKVIQHVDQLHNLMTKWLP